MIIAAGNNKLYGIFVRRHGPSELKQDPRFLEVKDRVANHEAMYEDRLRMVQAAYRR